MNYSRGMLQCMMVKTVVVIFRGAVLLSEVEQFLIRTRIKMIRVLFISLNGYIFAALCF